MTRLRSITTPLSTSLLGASGNYAFYAEIELCFGQNSFLKSFISSSVKFKPTFVHIVMKFN
jgi:hypothetical protein